MKILTKISAYSGAAAIVVANLAAGPALAQATRTWVMGTGDDVNPCSRTAPCKTFAGAISKTAAGGEINCVDPAGYGTLTITKSITIKCDYTLGSVLNSGTNGINVVAGATDSVILDGVAINGAGTTPGTRGVSFISGGSLIIRNSFIYGERTSPANGVSFTPNSAAKLFIQNTTIANNGTGSAGGGILIQPGTGASAVVELKDVHVINNGGFGVRVDGTTSAAGIMVHADNVHISGNANVGFNATASGTNPIAVMLANSAVTNNGTVGLVTIGTAVLLRVGNTTITGNATGVNPASGTISSYGDNRLDGNTNDGSFSGTVLPKH